MLDRQGSQVRRLAARKGAVQCRQFPPKDAFRRPVTNNVVHHQNKDMLLRSQAEQCSADSWFDFEMVETPRLGDQQTLHFRLTLCGRQRAEVDLLKAQRPVLVDNRHGLPVDGLDCGPQYLVSLDDGVKRLFHRVNIEFSPQPYRFGLVVNRQTGIQLLQKP